MKISIIIKIDKQTLRYAISALLMNDEKVNKGTIVFCITNEVTSRGTTLIDFPENWGDLVMDYYDENSEKVDSLVEKYKNLIEI